MKTRMSHGQVVNWCGINPKGIGRSIPKGTWHSGCYKI